MARPSQPKGRDDFEVAVICGSRKEAEAVEAVFDRFWSAEVYGKATADPNIYTLGVIGFHNVVLVRMPSTGKLITPEAEVGFQFSFPRIRLALAVGICGGVPYRNIEEKEMLLGDVIISTGLVEYHFGRQSPSMSALKIALQRSLWRPGAEIRSLLAKLQGYRSRIRLEDDTSHYLAQAQQYLRFDEARYPGVDADKLFEPTYRHKHHDFPACSVCMKCEKSEDPVCKAALYSSCLELKCNKNRLIPRQRLLKAEETGAAPKPTIHFGMTGFGDVYVKSGEDRDIMVTDKNIIAFDMKAARLWEHPPSIMIRGVCNYADGHVNKEWQGYAAATAAACLKAFLKEWFPSNKALGIISASEDRVSSNEDWNTSQRPPRAGTFVSEDAAGVLHGLERRETLVSNAFNSIPMQNLNCLSDSTNRADSDILSSINGHSTMPRLINDLYRCHLCLVLYVTWFTIISSSLSIGIWRSVATEDEGKGLTVAAYIIGVGGVIIWPIQMRHNDKCGIRHQNEHDA